MDTPWINPLTSSPLADFLDKWEKEVAYSKEIKAKSWYGQKVKDMSDDELKTTWKPSSTSILRINGVTRTSGNSML
jgi:hypothetical protein